MKKNRIKLAIGIFSAAFLFTAVSLSQSGSTDLVNATVQNPVATNIGVGSLSDQQLRDIAMGIVPGNIVKSKYEYEDGNRVVEYDIIDKNGLKRELTLLASNGKVYEIDYDYDAQGNRFINQSLFDVKLSYEQAQQIALERIPGKVLAHKQDSGHGLFIYEFVIQSNDGSIYELDVETSGGRILKVKREKSFNMADYLLPPVSFAGSTSNVQTGATAPQTEVTVPNVTQVTHQRGFKNEAEARQFVLGKFPGQVIEFEYDFDHGFMEYEYKIRQDNGTIVEVEVSSGGWIKDVDYKGRYVNGRYYKWD